MIYQNLSDLIDDNIKERFTELASNIGDVLFEIELLLLKSGLEKDKAKIQKMIDDYAIKSELLLNQHQIKLIQQFQKLSISLYQELSETYEVE